MKMHFHCLQWLTVNCLNVDHLSLKSSERIRITTCTCPAVWRLKWNLPRRRFKYSGEVSYVWKSMGRVKSAGGRGRHCSDDCRCDWPGIAGLRVGSDWGMTSVNLLSEQLVEEFCLKSISVSNCMWRCSEWKTGTLQHPSHFKGV